MSSRRLVLDPGSTTFHTLFSRHGVSCNHAIAVWLGRTLDRPVLESALDLLLRQQPVFGTQVEVVDSGNDHWPIYCWAKSPKPPQVPLEWQELRVGRAPVEAAIEEIAAMEVNRTIALNRDPPIRVIVRTHGGDLTWIMLVGSHVATDGRGLQLCMRDLLQGYLAVERGQTVAVEPMPLVPQSLDDILANPPPSNLHGRHTTARGLGGGMRQSDPVTGAPCYPMRSVGSDPSPRDRVRVRYFRLSRDQSASLAVAAGRAARATDLINLVLLYSMADVARERGQQLRALRLRLPMDLRPMLIDKRLRQSAGNLVTFVHIDIDVASELTGDIDADLTWLVRKKTQAMMGWREVFDRRQRFLRLLRSKEPTTGFQSTGATRGSQRRAGITMSHYGAVDHYYREMDELCIQRFEPYPLVRDLEIQAVSYDNQFTVVVAWMEAAVDPAGIVTLCDLLSEYLEVFTS